MECCSFVSGTVGFRLHTLSARVSWMPNGTTWTMLTWKECWRTRNVDMKHRARASTWIKWIIRSTIQGLWDSAWRRGPSTTRRSAFFSAWTSFGAWTLQTWRISCIMSDMFTWSRGSRSLGKVVERRLRRQSTDYRKVPRGWPSCVLSLGMRIVRLCSPSRRGDWCAKRLGRRSGRCTWMVRRSVGSRRVSS